jgi:zinc transport system substrate-binding protein
MKYAIGIIVLVILGVAGAALLSNTAPQEDGKLAVVATFYPLAYLAEEIGGERATVINLTPPGAEPHDYEPSPRDIASIERARLFIMSGNGIEPWAEDILRSLDAALTVSVIAGEGLATLVGEADEHDEADASDENEAAENEGEQHDEEEDVLDPHVWLSPVLMSAMADSVRAGFVQADPANAAYYEANAAALKETLAALDSEYRARLASCARSDIVVSHAAFAYLAREYGLAQLPIAGLSPEDEPSAAELVALREEARKHGATHVFFETLVSPKLAETLAAELNVETLVLNPLEGLTADQLAAGEEYVSQMRANLEHLSLALGCGT